MAAAAAPTKIGLASSVASLALATGALLGSAECAPSGFQDVALIQNGVRIFASRASKPYALSGDTVDVSVLAYDGRSAAQLMDDPEPMQVYWLPLVCVNPDQDAYYGCFPQLAAALRSGDGGATDAGTTVAAAGVAADAGAEDADAAAGAEDADAAEGGDAGLPAPVVSTYRIQVPSGIVLPRTGTDAYGLVILFNMACAGHLQPIPIDPGDINPQAVPVGCFDRNGRKLGPAHFVLGYTRVYVHDPNDPDVAGTTNTNPVIDFIDAPSQAANAKPGGQLPVDAGGPAPDLRTPTFIAPLCTGSGSCDTPKIGPDVPSSSWEPAANGEHEEVWADYYATIGSFKSDTRLLYDPQTGSLGVPGNSDTNYQPPIVGPADPRDGYIWIVVHDSRAGASWATIPLHLGSP